MNRILFVFTALLTLIFTSCEDTSIVGNDLLDDEKFDLVFEDNFNLQAVTIPSHLRISSNSGYTIFSNLTGKIVDPIFGETEASVYTRVLFNFSPKFENVILDSAVLIMSYDTAAYYGNVNAIHDLQIYEITEDYLSKDSIFSNDAIGTSSSMIGHLSFKALPKDSLSILNHDDTTLVKIPAQIRVRLDDVWANDFISNPLFADENQNGVDSFLYKVLKGFKIENHTNDNAMLGLGIGGTSTSQNSLNSLVIYYTKNDTTKAKGFYNFPVMTTRSCFTQGLPKYSGSSVGQAMNDVSIGDSLLYIQSFGGSSIKINFSDLSSLENKIINQAIIELTVAELPGDDIESFAPPTQLLAANVDKTTGKWSLISDAQNLFTVQSSSLLYGFGGLLETSSNVQKYKINVSNWIKERLKDPTLDRNLVITANLLYGIKNTTPPFFANERANRSVIFGPKNSQHPLKMRVTYTNQ